MSLAIIDDVFVDKTSVFIGIWCAAISVAVIFLGGDGSPKKPAAPKKKKSTGPKVKIGGVEYERSIIVLANQAAGILGDPEEATPDVATKTLGKEDVRKLWKDAKDGPRVTDGEFKTLEYILETYAMTKQAKDFLAEQVQGEKEGSAYYGKVLGKSRKEGEITVDAELYAHIQKLARDNSIDKKDAESIYEEAMDGGKITDVEKATIKKALEKVRLTAGAKTFLESKGLI